jgi:dienelactone hydrolase
LLKNYKVDKQKIVVMGYSEGAQVAPRLAVQSEYYTLYGFCGGGLNQLYDEVIQLRMQSESGQLSHQIATQKIDSLFVDFKKYMLSRIQLKIFGLVIPSKME